MHMDSTCNNLLCLHLVWFLQPAASCCAGICCCRAVSHAKAVIDGAYRTGRQLALHQSAPAVVSLCVTSRALKQRTSSDVKACSAATKTDNETWFKVRSG
jgi:hypothetical protein